MADFQFTEAEILVQPNANRVGPFTFDLSPQLPTGATITSIEVKAYRHDVETTTELIDVPAPVVAANVVTLYLKWPGAALAGKHKLTFIYMTVGGMVDEADFWYVLVEDV